MRNKISTFNFLIVIALTVTTFMGIAYGLGVMTAVNAEDNPSAEEVFNADGTAISEDAVKGGAFEVTDFNLKATVAKDHSYDVTEEIRVNIPKQIQNIKFSLPSGNFRMGDIEVQDTAYSGSTSSNNNSITIIDLEKLSEGRHTYVIKYKIREFEDRDASNDMFYFTLLPPEWKQPIGKLNINVSFPDDFPWDDIQCYNGQFGVQDVNNRVVFEDDEKSKTVTLTGERIPENYGITLKAELPNAYWVGALNGRWALNAILGITEAILLILALLWLIGGRDPKVERTVENKPPEGITTAEIGYIFNSEVSIRDILMILIYFAQKGYLKISEYEPKRYRIYKKEEPADEERFYRNAYNILFEDIYKDRAIEMEDLGERLVRVRDSIKDDIAAGYSAVDSSAFTPLSRVFRHISVVLMSIGLGVSSALTYSYEYLPVNYMESIVIVFIATSAAIFLCKSLDKRESQSDNSGRLTEILSGVALLGVILYVSYAVIRRTGSTVTAVIIAVSSVLSLFFIAVMRARGKDNAELVMRIRSLRNFIYHPTPKELLENHLADKNYYYDMLQYALTSGAEESWAISFLTLDVPEPDWYSDDIEGHAFSNLRERMTTVDYARDIKTFIRTIETAFADYMRRRRRR